jgi:hypothetical protein
LWPPQISAGKKRKRKATPPYVFSLPKKNSSRNQGERKTRGCHEIHSHSHNDCPGKNVEVEFSFIKGRKGT